MINDAQRLETKNPPVTQVWGKLLKILNCKCMST